METQWLWDVDPTVEQRMPLLYNRHLPFHNHHEHVRRRLDFAHFFLLRCRREKVLVDAQVVYYAIHGHDAGYHLNHINLGYMTKESLSATLTENLLREVHVAEERIRRVEVAILGTQQNAVLLSNEAKLVRAADLMGLAQPYEGFVHDNVLLRREHAMLTGEDLSWEEWKPATTTTVEFYLRQEIRLTRWFSGTDGSSVFHKAARANLERFVADDTLPGD